MNIRHWYLKLIGLLLIFGAILFLVIGPLLPRLVDISTYQQQIIAMLEDSLHRKISLGDIRFIWRFGPEFVIDDLHLRERTSTDEFLSARKITIHLGLLPLLRHQLALRTVVVDGLQATISRDTKGILNIADLLESRPDAISLKMQAIKLHQGTITWIDNACADGVQRLTLANIDLYLDHLSRGKKCSYKLAATLDKGNISGSGSIKLPKAGAPISTDLQVNGTLNLTQLDYSRLWPYYGHYLPFAAPGGTLDMEIRLKGASASFTASGMVRLQNAKVVWPTVFHGPVAPRQAQVRFDLQRTPATLNLSSFQLQTDGFAFQGALRLSDLQTSDPYLAVKGSTEPFEYQNIRSYIPFGIIADDAADFIEHKIKAGRFKLDNGTLAGRFSQLRHFTEGNNANALFINGTAEQAVVSYGPQLPNFNNIRGTLELKGRDFNLRRMSGAFGGSPFTLDGSITDYSTKGVVSEYPFQMQITPRPAEVIWLARLAGMDKLSITGDSTLRLNGEGPIKAYRLSGDWQLARAAYTLPAVIRKPAGMQNSLSFSSVLTKRETHLTALSYNLAPLKLSALATFRHGTVPPHLSFELQSNTFSLSPNLPIMTDWQQYHPKGTLQAHIIGSGDPHDFSAMQYRGSIRLNGFSIKPLATHPPLTAINGLIAFKGNSLETSRIEIRYGKTPLELRGRVASLKNPEAELFVTSPELHTSDFGLQTAEAPIIQKFTADLGFRSGLYTVRSISGRLKKTIFSAAGTIRPSPEPDLNLRVAATYLDLDELLPLIAPQQPAVPANATTPHPEMVRPFQLHGQLLAENGAYHELPFSRLKAQFLNDGGLLRLEELQANMFGGQLHAKGQLERFTDKPSKWALNLALDRMKSDELLHHLGISRETKGLMTVTGDLRAQGDSLEALKRSSTGNLSLMIERGQLRRFNTLAKVFSLLNVSQLLTLHLPDMVNEGMPFNQITATVGVKDGVLTSQDFFIDSNAMHISMVGTVNIVKEDLNLLIGVQPLQTVDKVISRIPVVGWILTGGDGSLITTYFEAKGNWADPHVTAIPVKSMASGTLNIFRRIFELPVRLFTDSGEVLLGNQKERPKAKKE